MAGLTHRSVCLLQIFCVFLFFVVVLDVPGKFHCHFKRSLEMCICNFVTKGQRCYHTNSLSAFIPLEIVTESSHLL